MKYASQTSVSVDRSIAELRKTVQRYGADQFGYVEGAEAAQVMFRIKGRMMRISLKLPDKEDFKYTPTGLERSINTIHTAWEQSCRQRWRALNLFVKATLEAVESGIVNIDQAFLTHIMLPDGSTVGEFMVPQIESAYSKGDMPKMLAEPK